MSRPCTLESLRASMTPEQRERIASDPRCSPHVALALRAGTKPATSTKRRANAPVEATVRRDGHIVTATLKGLALLVTPNARLHRQQSARMRASERRAVADALRGVAVPAGPWTVTIVRVSAGGVAMDDDNLTASAKGVRDEVSAWLGVDDGDVARVRFRVQQERGKGYSVRVLIEGRAW